MTRPHADTWADLDAAERRARRVRARETVDLLERDVEPEGERACGCGECGERRKAEA